MIRNGRLAGRRTGCSGIRPASRSPARAARAVTPASNQPAAPASATHNREYRAYTTMTAPGAATSTASDSQRSAPRRDRNQ